MNQCIHFPLEESMEISFCKHCHTILVLSKQDSSGSLNNSPNKHFSATSKIINSSLKPKEKSFYLEIRPLDILNHIRSQRHTTKTITPLFLEYLPKRVEVIKQIRLYTRKFGCGEEVFSLALILADKILISAKDFTDYFEMSNNINTCLADQNKETLTNSIQNKQTSNIIAVDLVVAACFLLSAKFLEAGSDIPELADIISINSKFNIKELEAYEVISLRVLDYKINWITPLQCLELFLCSGIFFEKELSSTTNTSTKTLKNVSTITVSDKIESAHQLCYNILNFIVSDFRSLEYRPEQIACAIISIVRGHFKARVKWHSYFIKLYEIKFEDFEECYNVMTR